MLGEPGTWLLVDPSKAMEPQHVDTASWMLPGRLLQMAGIHDAYFALTQVVAPELGGLTRAPDAPPPPEDAQVQQTDREMSDVALLRLDGKLEQLLPQDRLATTPATSGPSVHGPTDHSIGAAQ